MEGAFFVGRTELLAWVNSLLHTSLTKVEQCASAAVYCQILDSCHPGTVSMKKVNWMARSDHEFIPNYKVLQAAFDKNNIQRHIAVDQLIRAKYQDNLEFLQFMKCYWEHEGARHGGYDPTIAREGKQLPPWAKSSSPEIGGAAVLRTATPGEKENIRPRQAPTTEAKRAPAAVSTRAAAPPLGARAPPTKAAVGPTSAEHAALQQKVTEQTEEIEDLRATVEGIENERDYYFRKLREVEILCTNLQAKLEATESVESAEITALQVVTDVQSILYAENEEEEEGNPTVPVEDP